MSESEPISNVDSTSGLFDLPRRAREIAQGLLNPPGPRRWPELARALSRSHGWEPLMLMIAGFGVLGPLALAAARFGQWGLLSGAFAATFITWIIIGAIATAVVARRSVQNISRLGLQGLGRPRFWFEGARLSWITFLFAASLLPPLIVLEVAARVPGRLVATIGEGVLFVAACSFPLFLGLASIGYVLSFFRRLPRVGRAFECVNFFYVLTVGITLLTIAAAQLPMRAFWPDGFTLSICGASGIALFLGGFASICDRYTAFERQERQP